MASPPLLARWVQWFGCQGMWCSTITMSTVMGRRRDAIYVSNVIKLLKLFLVMSELSEMFWGKMHRIWSLGGLNVAELQGQGNKEICLVFVGRMIFAPHWRCQFVGLGSGWGDRKTYL